MMMRSVFIWSVGVFLLMSFVASCKAFVSVNGPSFARPCFVPCDSRRHSTSVDGNESTSPDASNSSQSNELRSLYPPSEANRNGTIAVDDIHTLFYQEYGQNASNKDALIALFTHGGPGAGCSPNHARFFDPNKYRIVLLDQRGCGQSTPLGEVRRNTLQLLVHDCEILRSELGIQHWDVVLGGSWGTTLALAYAQTYPDSVRSMLLRGVCLMRPFEVDWLFSSKGGAASLDPEGWKNFSISVGVSVEHVYDDSGRAALHAYYDRLLGDDPTERIAAAKSWMFWEMRVSSLARRSKTGTNSSKSLVFVWKPSQGWSYQNSQGHQIQNASFTLIENLRQGICTNDVSAKDVLSARIISPIGSSEVVPILTPTGSTNKRKVSFIQKAAAKFIPAQAMLTCFYSVNERYATGNANLLAEERIDRLRKIPCIAVQGGKDTICPPDTALDLHEAWPEMELRIPSDAGHSMYDPGIMNELIRATDHFSGVLIKHKLF